MNYMEDWILVQKQSNLLFDNGEIYETGASYFWLQGHSERDKPLYGAETHCVSLSVCCLASAIFPSQITQW